MLNVIVCGARKEASEDLLAYLVLTGLGELLFMFY